MIKLISTLDKIAELLLSVEETNWYTAFKGFRERCDQKNEQDVKLLKSDILGIYGGMGSFSDLVLYSEGQVLIEKNQRLDELRNELFEIVKAR